MPYADKEKMREYQRLWCAKRREAFFADKVCVQCGSSTDLELDHVDPSKKVSHRIWSWSESRRAAEIAKCQVLCADCHLAKTLEQRPSTDHGRGLMYQRGCRCADCRAWKSAANRKYRSARVV